MVDFASLYDHPEAQATTALKPICEIQEAEAFPSGIDSMGEISGGRLVLTGPMKKSVPRVHGGDYYSRGYADWYDCPKMQRDPSRRGETFHFGVAYHEEIRDIHGLILQTTDVPGQFLRVGAFAHPYRWVDSFRDETRLVLQSPVVQEDFPEFAEFDPANFERRTVTIV